MSTADAGIVRVKTYDISICSATVLSHAKIQGENMSQIQTFNVNITTLNRERKVWVYLPDGYSEKGTPIPSYICTTDKTCFTTVALLTERHGRWGKQWTYFAKRDFPQ